MLLFSFPYLVARQIIWVIFPLRFIMSLTPVFILVLFFYLKAYLRCTEPFRMKPDGLHVTSLFWVTIGIMGLSVLELFLLGLEKFFVLLKHICLWGATALVAGVSLVSILQAGDLARVSTPARHCFSPYITTVDQHQDSVTVLCWASVSRSSLGKCQTLTYIQFCICQAVALPSTGKYFPNCLCSISTTQLELLLWRAGLTAHHLPLNVCLAWLHWLRGSGTPGATLWQG